MANQSSRTKPITIRMPLKELAAVDSYAAANGISRSSALLHYVRVGLADESGERPATRSDLVALAAQITKAIEDRPVQVQQVPAIDPPREERKPWWRRLIG